jgi:hypothetical protein
MSNGDQNIAPNLKPFPAILHRHAREILDLELGQQRIVQAGRVIAERSELEQQPMKRLGDSQLDNLHDQIDARQAWLAQWMLY